MKHIFKNSQTIGGIPAIASLSDGELAVNTVDGKMFLKRDDDVIIEYIEWKPFLHHVVGIADRDALVTGGTVENGQYCFYVDNGNDITEIWVDGAWVLVEKVFTIFLAFFNTNGAASTFNVSPGTTGTVNWGAGDIPLVVGNNTGTAIVGFDVVVKSTNCTKITFTSNTFTNITLGSQATSLVDCSSMCKNLTALTKFETRLDATLNVVTFLEAWMGCTGLTVFSTVNMDSVQNLSYAWHGCSNIMAFGPLNTPQVTNIDFTWFNNSSLTTIPLYDFFDVITANDTWNGCSSMLGFPFLNYANCQSFNRTWRNCSSMVYTTSINSGSGTSFDASFEGCSGLVCMIDFNTSNIAAPPATIFGGCVSLVAPNAAEQVWLEGGYNYLNVSLCP